MGGNRGRPSKYAPYVNSIEDWKVYSPSSIVEQLDRENQFQLIRKSERGIFKTRMKQALKFASQQLPDEYDGRVKLSGAAQTEGYFGWRWKQKYFPGYKPVEEQPAESIAVSSSKDWEMKIPQRGGGPLKYAHLMNYLEEDIIYSVACIVDLAINRGAIDPNDTVLCQRIRLSFCRLISNREFPEDGDGMIRRKGQSPRRGFFGKRYKAAVNCKDNSPCHRDANAEEPHRNQDK